MNERLKKALMDNWGDKANAMQCYAEVKFINPSTSWACYVYALDPADGDTIMCLVINFPGFLCEWSLKELLETYDIEGERVIEDPEFRRIRVSELFKRLSGGI